MFHNDVVMADTLSKAVFFSFWKIAAENEVFDSGGLAQGLPAG